MDMIDKVRQYKQRGLTALETYNAIRAEGIQVPWLEVKALWLKA